MHLEPQAVGAAGKRIAEVLGLEAETRGERLLERSHSASRAAPRALTPPRGAANAESVEANAQAFASSEPLPFGVLISVQVPLATLFQALPW